MPRYVNVDNIGSFMLCAWPDDEYAIGWNEAIAKIETSAPTADVAPVIHGHWIVTDNGVNGKTADCSVCGSHFVYFKGHLQIDKMPGCPKCFARMDEDVESRKAAEWTERAYKYISEREEKDLELIAAGLERLKK